MSKRTGGCGGGGGGCGAGGGGLQPPRGIPIRATSSQTSTTSQPGQRARSSGYGRPAPPTKSRIPSAPPVATTGTQLRAPPPGAPAPRAPAPRAPAPRIPAPTIRAPSAPSDRPQARVPKPGYGGPTSGKAATSTATSTARPRVSDVKPMYQKKKPPPSSGYGPKRDAATGVPGKSSQLPSVASTTSRQSGASSASAQPRPPTSRQIKPPTFAKVTTQMTKKEPNKTTTKQITKLGPTDPDKTRPTTSRQDMETTTVDTHPDLDETSPYAPSHPKSTTMSILPPRSPLGPISTQSTLSTDVEKELEQAARHSPDKVVVVTGARAVRTTAPTIMTDDGPVQAVKQIISEKTVEKSPGVERITRSMIGYELESGSSGIRTELEMQRLEQLSPPPHPSTPSRETVCVRSVISVTPDGKKESQTFVTYDTTKPSENYGLTAEDVKRMVVEENQDVRKSLKWKPIELLASTHTSFSLKKKEHDYSLNDETLAELQKSVVIPDSSPDEAPQDELQPELMATIMHTEEKGMDMLAEPTTVYTYLFPDCEDLGPDVIEINSAAPAPLHDVAVPSHSLPEAFYNNSLNPELEKIIMESEGTGNKPSASGYSEFQEKQAAKHSKEAGGSGKESIVTTIKKRQKKAKEKHIEAVPIQDEKPPWGEESTGPGGHGKSLMDLVGASPVHGTASEIPNDSFSIGLQSADAQDYVLYVEPPVYRSKVQLRGSTMPPWFPGNLNQQQVFDRLPRDSRNRQRREISNNSSDSSMEEHSTKGFPRR